MAILSSQGSQRLEFTMLASGVVFLSALILALPFGIQAADNYPDCGPQTLRTYDLLGPVHSVRVEVRGADGRGRSLIERYVFDRSGRLLEDRHEIAVSTGNAATEPRFQVFRNVYERKGRNYETDDFEVEPAGGERPIDLQRHFVKFDSVGRCIEETTVDSDGSLDLKKIYEYDSQGNLINEVYQDADGAASSVERAYGLDHQLLSEKGIGWSTNSSRAYRYDALGNRTDEFDYEQGVLEAHRIYHYDDRNRLISSETVVDPGKDQHAYRCGDCSPSSGKTIYTYDGAGRLIESRMFEPGDKLVNATRNSYDAHGTRLDSPDTTYIYDSHGNWIKTKAEDGNYTWRVIDYYRNHRH